MKRAAVNGTELAYVERGSGAETVVFSHSYLVDHRHFEPQIEALAEHYRVVAYDHRDHGRSARTPERYRLDDLVADAAGVIEATGSAPCHFVGLSTGGFIGLRLALHRPELLRSVTLMDTSAEAEPALKRLKYHSMFLVLRALGFGPLIRTVTGLMFGPALLEAPERRDEVERWQRLMRENDRGALIRFGKAIFDREDLVADLDRIETPSLVVVGEFDRPQPPVRARTIAEGIPGARLEVIAGAGHLSTVDAPDAVTRALESFLGSLS